ncbi:50S ribosomal protein L18 [Candidatus Saccharibacteria bacterium]|nr:50S ribosomal protein L18 [Candidatus Saccharibacteria bacterium]
MSITKKLHNLRLRKNRIRARISGTATRPRMSISVSNLHVSAQIIDDTLQRTLVSATSVGQKSAGENLSAKAEWVGAEIAKKAKAKKIKLIVLDRNGRRYHGRVKALAESARAGGLEF